MEDSLNILLSSRHDNEISTRELIKLERTIINSKMLSNYIDSKLNIYYKISYSINRVKEKIKEKLTSL